ncbi:RsmD family RNA methyltransferase [Halobacteriovorax sp.]|uniref:RsmD family RNA methyltransferase n=1 Tax=Halobacteriovorax sp. TaxID=2020862 RepID=UPI0035690FB6
MKKSKNILNYSQPNFYKFSRDSIELADLAVKYEKENLSLQVLELFAGSGVIGVEFENKHQSVEHITFIELQEEFEPYLKENTKNLNCDFKIFFQDFRSLDTKKKYDVILLNPPYFDSKKSRIGSDDNRNLCRFILNFELKDIFKQLESCLSKSGSAYICHCDNLEELDTRVSRVGEYQGVGLFRFRLNVNRA